jgi:hypothetical protein
MGFERSLTGNSSAACVDEARRMTPGYRGRGKKGRVYIARPADAIPRGTCARCGLIGSHATPDECIDALRSVIADLK